MALLSSSLTTTQKRILKDGMAEPVVPLFQQAKTRELKKAVEAVKAPPAQSNPVSQSAAPIASQPSQFLGTQPSNVTQLIKEALQKRIQMTNGGLQPFIASALDQAQKGPNMNNIDSGVSLNQAIASQANQQQGLVDRAQGLLGLQQALGNRFDSALKSQADIFAEQNKQAQQQAENERQNQLFALQQQTLQRGLDNDTYQQAKDYHDQLTLAKQQDVENARQNALLELQQAALKRNLTQDEYQKGQDAIKNMYDFGTLQSKLGVDPWTGELTNDSKQILASLNGESALSKVPPKVRRIQSGPAAMAANKQVGSNDDTAIIATISPLISVVQNSPNGNKPYMDLLQAHAQDYVNAKIAGGQSHDAAVAGWINVYKGAQDALSQQASQNKLASILPQKLAETQAGSSALQQEAISKIENLATNASKGPGDSKLFIQAYLQAKNGVAPSDAEVNTYLREHNPGGGNSVLGVGFPTMGLWPDQVEAMKNEVTGQGASNIQPPTPHSIKVIELSSGQQGWLTNPAEYDPAKYKLIQ